MFSYCHWPVKGDYAPATHSGLIFSKCCRSGRNFGGNEICGHWLTFLPIFYRFMFLVRFLFSFHGGAFLQILYNGALHDFAIDLSGGDIPMSQQLLNGGDACPIIY